MALTAALCKTPSPDRPLWQRWTVIGGSLMAVVTYLEAQGVIQSGNALNLAELVQHLGGVLAALGLYRHIPTT